MRLLLISLLLCSGLTAPAAARTVFPVYGAQGDSGATDECPAGSYFVGLVGNAGVWIDQITVVCGRLRPDGSVSGGKSLPSRGGTGGGFKSALCARDEVVSRIRAARTDGYQIAFVTMTCLNLRTLVSRRISFAGSRGGQAQMDQECKSAELGAGLVIRYGKHVNGVGLICGDDRRHQRRLQRQARRRLRRRKALMMPQPSGFVPDQGELVSGQGGRRRRDLEFNPARASNSGDAS